MIIVETPVGYVKNSLAKSLLAVLEGEFSITSTPLEY